MSSMDEFIAQIQRKGGPAYLNRFEVIILSPFEANADIEADRLTSFKVQTLTIPGKNLRTTPNENIYGPTYEMAQGLTYAESVAMTFYLSTEHFERDFFVNWIDMIIKPDSYNLEYYDNYKRDITIFQLDRQDQKTAGYILKDAYPKTVGAIEMSQSSSELGTINVDFSFKEVIQTDANGRAKNSGYRPSTSTTRPRMLTPPSSPYGAMDR